MSMVFNLAFAAAVTVWIDIAAQWIAATPRWILVNTIWSKHCKILANYWGLMMQVMTKEQAAARGLFTKDPITGKQVPFTTWRPELTPEQKAKYYDDLAKGIVPF